MMAAEMVSTGRALFFQAEDGIRVRLVTGVQTCALPILYIGSIMQGVISKVAPGTTAATPFVTRSEERRVGKECRSRWSPYHEKKKKIKAWDPKLDQQTTDPEEDSASTHQKP